MNSEGHGVLTTVEIARAIEYLRVVGLPTISAEEPLKRNS